MIKILTKKAVVDKGSVKGETKMDKMWEKLVGTK